LKAIFKAVKERIKEVLDFDSNKPLKKVIKSEDLDLQSPYHEVSRAVNKRLNFLLDLVPSFDYHSKLLSTQ